MGVDGYTAEELLSAYGVTGNGAGQTVAIVDAYNDPDIFGDVNGYDEANGNSLLVFPLYDPNLLEYGPASSFLTVYDQNGNVIDPSTESSIPYAPSGSPWGTEISADVELAHAFAPAAHIDLVEGSDPLNLYPVVVTAAGLPGVSVVSMSWGDTTPTGPDSDFVHPGVTFVAASGDSGMYWYPAASPNVVGVGGTELTINPTTYSWESEEGWANDIIDGVSVSSGGGLDTGIPEPSYQEGVQTSGDREGPDVALNAVNDAIYDSYDFGTNTPWSGFTGTSVAAPAWAGMFADIDQIRALEGIPALECDQSD